MIGRTTTLVAAMTVTLVAGAAGRDTATLDPADRATGVEVRTTPKR